MAQQVRNMALSLKWLGSLLWLGFDPWPGNFNGGEGQPKKKKKKEIRLSNNKIIIVLEIFLEDSLWFFS